MRSSLPGYKRQATRNPQHIGKPNPPVVPPKELLEDIKALEFGRVPLPTLKLFYWEGDEYINLEDEENWKNLLRVLFARISAVPVLLQHVSNEAFIMNMGLRRGVEAKYPLQPGRIRYLDEDQLDKAGPGGGDVDYAAIEQAVTMQPFNVNDTDTDFFAPPEDLFTTGPAHEEEDEEPF